MKSNGASKRFFPISIALAAAAIVSFVLVSRGKSAMPPEFHFAVAHLLLVWFGLAILAWLIMETAKPPRAWFRLLALLALADAWGTLSIDRSTILTRATEPWWEVMNSQHVRTLDLSTTGVNRLAVDATRPWRLCKQQELTSQASPRLITSLYSPTRFHRRFVE